MNTVLSRPSASAPDPFSPVNENGSFEFDRVLKTGRVCRRVKHKHVFRASWKPAYLVLRPNLLSVYKDEETTRLRVSVSLSEVTAVAPVKSPRSTRRHVFGVFTPSTNYRFEAPTERDADEWITRIRASIPNDEHERALLGLVKKQETPTINKQLVDDTTDHSDFDHTGRASSPEPRHALSPRIGTQNPPLHSGLLGQRTSFAFRVLRWARPFPESSSTINAFYTFVISFCARREILIPAVVISAIVICPIFIPTFFISAINYAS
ncbi:uncharacterized protein N7506_010418 [Penicillium brevicompactum]|uniref:uncharacterized protein n=1 Tax=Penicillium brevicompactum TaxID=5074 RepID=UPI00254105E8|nr:uncharacterized protein N7506_010418 [Penicillium brevicompactum]KAJ5327316.1 hypothetical protein N7506_010418 [Penicillium brevicompactum]